MRDRTEWTRGDTTGKVVEFSRPCVTCGKPFSIRVSHRIADGKADSNSFGLKNCELHRRGKIVDELETIRAELAVLKRRDQELFAENMALKAKLAALEKKMPWE